MLETWKLAPALASGCTVVLKPAEWTPLSASLLPEIMTEAGLPDGAFNLVHGIGEVAGAALVAHPGVPRISFTGETGTGRTIMAAAAPHLKGLSMELGGKSPCLIFADADLDRAVDSALFGVFSLNGERCTAGSRILAERPIYDALVTRLAARAERIKVGDPSDPATEIGRLCIPSTTLVCSPTCGPGRMKARGWWPAERARPGCPKATTWPPRCSPTSIPPCGSSARRSSGRSCA
jgi:5-carboxymethyl-2-hydroxymuconic-semialdehyde dehydrogenase